MLEDAAAAMKQIAKSGIDGFDGSRKEAPKSVVQAINE